MDREDKKPFNRVKHRNWEGGFWKEGGVGGGE